MNLNPNFVRTFRLWCMLLLALCMATSCEDGGEQGEYLRAEPEEELEVDTLRLISYNILEGMKLDQTTGKTELAAWVRSMNPDILALQEANRFTQESLERLAASYGHPYVVTNIKKGDNYPVALTSKYPVEVIAKITEGVSHGAIHARIRGVNIVVLHLWPHASELGLNPKKAKRAGLLHDIGKVPDDEPELPHAILGMKLCEKYKEKPDICNAVGAHHDEVEMQTLLAPIVQVCDAISGARPGARREIVEAYIKRLNDLEQLALSYPGVVKTYAIQAGRELRVIVGADKIDDKDTENLSAEIAKKIQDEMTYPGQVKITVIRETRAVSYAK